MTLFNNEKFSINQLLNLYLHIENLFFDKIKGNIISDYDFPNNFDEGKDIDMDSISLISKNIELNSALKRYISRYLIDKNYANNNLDKKLSLELSRAELWNVNETQFNEIKEILNKEFEKLNLTKKEAIALYEFIKIEKED